MLKNRLLDSIKDILPVYRNGRAFNASESGLAWNIRLDMPLAKDVAAPEHVAAFEKWLDESDEIYAELFNDSCETALAEDLKTINEFAAKDLRNQDSFTRERGVVELTQAGKSGGWLLLQRWEADCRGFRQTYRFDVDAEGVEETINGMSRNTLIKFRRLIKKINEEFSPARKQRFAAWLADGMYEYWLANVLGEDAA